MTLYLCGFMGCGKSTVGKLLAEKSGLKFTDLDDYIEEKEQMSIPEIFAQKGEGYFREREAAAVKELSAENSVVACGGGTIINDNSARIARENGTVFFLDIPFETCYSRIKDDTHRPLVVNNTKEQLHGIFSQRHDIYLKNSTLSVNADNTPEAVCDEIMNAVKNI
ncbi:MAG: shikimate kinase [Oscillospiraceae bacterium]|nr:shikimate kinase [Oscillospiraceae bacterium]